MMSMMPLQATVSDSSMKATAGWFLERNKDKNRPLTRILKSNPASFFHHVVQLIIRNRYHIAPSLRVVNDRGEVFEVWNDQDRFVHKLLELQVRKTFYHHLSKRCIHLKGHGGMPIHLHALNKALQRYRYVYRTDIKSFYASIPHKQLMKMLRRRMDDPVLIRLLYETISAPIWVNGELVQRQGKGIPLTCPLSPLLAAIYLSSIDQLFDQKQDIFYVRYMDDFIILTKNKKRLEEVVRLARQEMNELKLDPHPRKTFVGKTIRGFSSLGYDFQGTASAMLKAPHGLKTSLKILTYALYAPVFRLVLRCEASFSPNAISTLPVTERPPKKAGGPIRRKVTQVVRAETMRRCFLRSLILYKKACDREQVEGYWKRFLIWCQHRVSEKDQWLLWNSERRWDYFLTQILPFYSTA